MKRSLELTELIRRTTQGIAFRSNLILQTDWTGASYAANRGTVNFAATTANSSLPALTPLEAFLAGIPNSGAAFNTLQVGNPNENFSWKSYWAFVQDDWRLTPRVTVNLGLRYEFEAPMRSMT